MLFGLNNFQNMQIEMNLEDYPILVDCAPHSLKSLNITSVP